MSRHDRYPSVDGNARPLANFTEPTGGWGECECCAKPAAFSVNVRFGPMRGTDIEAYNVCERHRAMWATGGELGRFLAHAGSKEKFVSKGKT